MDLRRRESDKKESGDEGNKKRTQNERAGSSSKGESQPPTKKMKNDQNLAINNTKIDDSNPRPALPSRFKEKIEQESKGKRIIGNEILVIQKHLQESDVNKKNCCFIIPQSQTLNRFLSNEEEDILKGASANSSRKMVNYIDGTIIDPTLNMGTIRLKRWENPSIRYALSKGWTRIVNKNNLKAENLVQLWAVRVGQGDLWFVLVNLTPNREEGNNTATTTGTPGGSSSNAAKPSSPSSSSAAAAATGAAPPESNRPQD